MTIFQMNEDILPPSDDYIFKAVLTNPNTKVALMDLITSATGRNITSVAIRNNELPVTDNREKNERLDVNCKIDDGSQINIEMQASALEGPAGGRLFNGSPLVTEIKGHRLFAVGAHVSDNIQYP